MNSTTRLIIFIILGYIISSTYSHAQNAHLFTTDNGLSNSLINDIIQDKYGYIWVATEDGLNRFDGVNFKNYKAEELSHGYVHSLYEDRQGTLWIGTLTGLLTYSRETDTFCRVPIIVKGDTLEAHISDIIEDSHGNIWAASTGRGLLLCQNNIARDCHEYIGVNEIEFLSSVTIEVETNSKGIAHDNLWIVAYKNGVYRINLKTKEVSLVPIADNRPLAENAYTQYINGKVYLSAGGTNLLVYNPEHHMFEPMNINCGDAFCYALCTNDDKLLLGTDGNGLFSYNQETKEIQRQDYYSPELNFSRAKIHSIYIDRDNGIWLGLFQKGVMYIPRSLGMIKSYGYKPNSTSNISSAAITSILAGKNNDLWIGTDGNGMFYVNQKGIATHVDSDIPPTIMAIEHTKDNNLWLCAYSDGLLLYDTKKNKLQDYNDILNKAQRNYNRRTTCMATDNKDRLWVGTYGSGVFCLGSRVENHMSTSEEYNYNRNEPANNYINTIHVIDDNVWMGTFKGVSCYNTKIGAFVVVDRLLHDNIGAHVVYDICDDNEGTIWFATDIGLVQYIPKEKKIEIIDKTKGLASEIAVGVLCDSIGRTWVSTFNGISCYDSKNNTIDNYYSHHGLQGNQFSRAAITLSTNGDLYLGSVSGVTGFNPNTITPELGHLNLSVTRFLLNGQEVNSLTISDNGHITTKSIIETDTFSISYNDKSFTLELSTFNFTSKDRMRYEYKINELHDKWIANKLGDNLINIRNLRPGTYNIQLQASLDNLVSDIKTITVIVRPMWWQTWWSIAIYSTVILTIILMLIHSARQRQKIKIVLQEQEHAHNIEEAKFQFFFNLSHEIRTPLTLIINPIKELMSETNDKNYKKYTLIYRNSMRILRLINQLLDVRKIEKGQMTMQFTTVNIVSFVDELEKSFDYMAKSRDIQMKFNNTIPEDTTADIDLNQFDKVLYNLYSNALKFTPEGGRVTTTISKDGENVVIKIEDNGNGIDPNKLDKIFERFYQENNEHNAQYIGTGIGLNYARSIVELHNGTITAANQIVGPGAIFSVSIPRRQKVANIKKEPESFTLQSKDTYTTVNTLEKERHRPSTNKVLLIVDDEPEISTFLQNELSRTYKIVTRSNGKEAYDYAVRNHIDMVISDVMMPEMDGMTLCKKIKSNINLNHIPVILLTAKHSEEDRNKGLLTGADAYIAKPFDVTHLRGTIHSILANRDRIMSRINLNNNNNQNQSQEKTNPRKVVAVKSQNEVLMQKVTKYIEEHIAEPDLNVAALASYVGMSRVHMHRKLKELIGQSARDYIKNIRLRQAGILLGEKQLNISDVAYALGYNNLSHFSASFRDFYGMSPKDYMHSINNEIKKENPNREENEEQAEKE